MFDKIVFIKLTTFKLITNRRFWELVSKELVGGGAVFVNYPQQAAPPGTITVINQ